MDAGVFVPPNPPVDPPADPPVSPPNPPADTQPPETTITGEPAKKTKSKRATFEFAASEVATFRCKLDSGQFASCSSPNQLSGLKPGNHSFSVVATDAAGNADPTPATFSWKVKKKRR